MQETIGRALDFEQKRLTTIVRNHLKPSDISALNNLLDNSESLYEITQLKREPKDFSWSEIKREINRGGQIHLLYSLTKRLLPELNISGESIKYYASKESRCPNILMIPSQQNSSKIAPNAIFMHRTREDTNGYLLIAMSF